MPINQQNPVNFNAVLRGLNQEPGGKFLLTQLAGGGLQNLGTALQTFPTPFNFGAMIGPILGAAGKQVAGPVGFFGLDKLLER